MVTNAEARRRVAERALDRYRRFGTKPTEAQQRSILLTMQRNALTEQEQQLADEVLQKDEQGYYKFPRRGENDPIKQREREVEHQKQLNQAYQEYQLQKQILQRQAERQPVESQKYYKVEVENGKKYYREISEPEYRDIQFRNVMAEIGEKGPKPIPNVEPKKEVVVVGTVERAPPQYTFFKGNPSSVGGKLLYGAGQAAEEVAKFPVVLAASTAGEYASAPSVALVAGPVFSSSYLATSQLSGIYQYVTAPETPAIIKTELSAEPGRFFGKVAAPFLFPVAGRAVVGAYDTVAAKINQVYYDYTFKGSLVVAEELRPVVPQSWEIMRRFSGEVVPTTTAVSVEVRGRPIESFEGVEIVRSSPRGTVSAGKLRIKAGPPQPINPYAAAPDVIKIEGTKQNVGIVGMPAARSEVQAVVRYGKTKRVVSSEPKQFVDYATAQEFRKKLTGKAQEFGMSEAGVKSTVITPKDYGALIERQTVSAQGSAREVTLVRKTSGRISGKFTQRRIGRDEVSGFRGRGKAHEYDTEPPQSKLNTDIVPSKEIGGRQVVRYKLEGGGEKINLYLYDRADIVRSAQGLPGPNYVAREPNLVASFERGGFIRNVDYGRSTEPKKQEEKKKKAASVTQEPQAYNANVGFGGSAQQTILESPKVETQKVSTVAITEQKSESKQKQKKKYKQQYKQQQSYASGFKSGVFSKTEYVYAQSEEQVLRPMERVSSQERFQNRTRQRVYSASALRFGQRVDSALAVRERQDVRERVREEEALRERARVGFVPRVRTGTKLRLAQQSKQLQRQGYDVTQKTIYGREQLKRGGRGRGGRGGTNEQKPEDNGKIDKKKDFDVYTVEVRRRGKFERVGVLSSLSSAFSLGERVVESSAAASFRVLDEGAPVSASALSPRFRQSRREAGVFIQKREFRISSGGERAEITYKGIAASRNKRAVRWRL